MTPQEKAKELVDKFYYIPNSQGIFMMQDYQAKECALIAVDEMLSNDGWSSSPKEWDIFKKYCKNVKQEIEKL